MAQKGLDAGAVSLMHGPRTGKASPSSLSFPSLFCGWYTEAEK